ncbi:MAG: hypothetical protein IAF02_19270 [Anaerolineae bacterium]|nr:hypothetical protein [Anaerolineae bacterium]
MNNWELNKNDFLNEFTQRFNLDDIKKLCFALNIDYESLAGEPKEIKALSLYQKCERDKRLTDLVDECEKAVPVGNWRVFLQSTTQQPKPISIPSKAPTKRGLWVLVGVLAVVVLGLVAWLMWGNGRDASTSELDDGLVFDFEKQSELINWVIKLGNETMTPERTQKESLTGRYALQINTNLTVPNLQDDQQKTPIPQILLDTKDLNLEHKIIIYRVYAPADAPDNLAAQLFVPTGDGNIWGDSTYTHLTPGEWTTLSWAPGLSASEIGIEIKMDDVFSNRSRPTYTGDVYIDRVEILETNLIDTFLKPTNFYAFDNDNVEYAFQNLTVLERHTTNVIPKYFFESNGIDVNALRMDLELPAAGESAPTPDNSAGLVININDEPVEAILTMVLVENIDNPMTITLQGKPSDEGELIRASFSVEPGQWTPIFWPVRGNDFDNVSYTAADLKEIDVLITSTEAYEGPIYFDYLGVYRYFPKQ